MTSEEWIQTPCPAVKRLRYTDILKCCCGFSSNPTMPSLELSWKIMDRHLGLPDTSRSIFDLQCFILRSRVSIFRHLLEVAIDSQEM